MRLGSRHSSAMLTESSKPTMAKKASVVAPTTDQMTPCPGVALNSRTRPRSPCPAPIAQNPITMMIRSPLSSTMVNTTLAFTLSLTPRKLTSAMTAMKTSPASVRPAPSRSPRPNASDRLAAKAREAVEADVMPELITAKATMKVRKWMPNALCV
jgi:hypothetical protein